MKHAQKKKSARVAMPLSHPVTIRQLPDLVRSFASQMAEMSGQPVEILIPVATMYIMNACTARLPEVEAYYPVNLQ